MHLKEKQLLLAESNSLKKRTAMDLQYPIGLSKGIPTGEGELADAAAASSPLSNLGHPQYLHIHYMGLTPHAHC